jgi:hypothetical protein
MGNHLQKGVIYRLGKVIYGFFCIIAAVILFGGAWFLLPEIESQGWDHNKRIATISTIAGAAVIWLIGNTFHYIFCGVWHGLDD